MGNCFRRKIKVEELENDLAGKSLLKGVLLYVNRNHFFNSFKGLLAFTFFVIVIYQRLYTRWFAIICRLRYKGALSVITNRKSLDETAIADEEKGMNLIVTPLLRLRYFEFLLFPSLF